MPTEHVRWNGAWVEVFSGGGQTATTVDSLEDGNIDEYSGDTGAFTVDQNSPVWDGSYSLKGDVASASGSIAIIISTAGLPTYPSIGDTFVADLRANTNAGGTANAGILFGAVDQDNHYFCRFVVEDDELQLYKRSSGSATLLGTGSTTVSADTHYQIRIVWASDDTITGNLIDPTNGSTLTTATGSDSEFAADDGIGWYTTSGTGAVFDNMRITNTT